MYYINSNYLYQTYKYMRSRSLKLVIEYTDGSSETLTSSSCKENSFYVDSKAVNGTALQFGASYMSEMGITVLNKKSQINKFEHAIIKPYVTVDESAGSSTTHEIPMGVFEVDSIELVNNSDLSLVCYDQMKKLNIQTRGTLKGKMYDVLTTVCNDCGVQLGLTKAQINQFPGTRVFYGLGKGAFDSCRDIIEQCAEIMCSFAYFDRTGKLMFRKFGIESDNSSRSFSVPLDFINYAKFDYYDYKIKNFLYLAQSYTLNSNTGNTSGFEMVFGEGNKMFSSLWREHKLEKQNVMREIGPAVRYINYRGASLKIWCEPTIDTGDIMEIEGYGNIYVMHSRYTLYGLQDIECYGIDKDLYRGKTSLQRRLTDLSSSQSEIKFDISTKVVENQQVNPPVQTRRLLKSVRSSVSPIPSSYTTVVTSDYSVYTKNIYLSSVLNVYADADCTLTYFNVIQSRGTITSVPVVCKQDIKAGYNQICWNDCIEFEYLPDDLLMTVGIGVVTTGTVSILEDGSKIIVFSLSNGTLVDKDFVTQTVFNSTVNIAVTGGTV